MAAPTIISAGRLSMVLAATLPLLLGACAGKPPADPAARAAYEQNNDPYESTNRAIFDVNDKIYTYALFPVVRTYNTVVPEPARDGIHNAVSNVGEPVVILNKTLQGDVSSAGTAIGRFLIKSVFGFGGIIDVASHNHIEEPKGGDFGGTLASYGVGEGPYLVLPFFGPSNPRDAVGLAADSASDPFQYVAYTTYPEQIAMFGVRGVDRINGNMDNYEQAKKTSLDFYAFLRSSYRQNRRYELGEPAATDDSLYDAPSAKPDPNDHP
jgi:phospholipid-binding lipoprotein MlaA